MSTTTAEREERADHTASEVAHPDATVQAGPPERGFDGVVATPGRSGAAQVAPRVPAVHALLGEVRQDPGHERRMDRDAGDAAQRRVLPSHREHGQNSEHVVVPRPAPCVVTVEHGSAHEHERQQEPGLDTQHPGRRRGRGPAPKRLDQRDPAGDAEGEHDDRNEPLGGEAPVAVAHEHAEPDRVPAHVRDEQAGEGEEAGGVDVPGHHRERERQAVRGTRDLDLGLGHTLLRDRRAP